LPFLRLAEPGFLEQIANRKEHVMNKKLPYGFGITIDLPYPRAVERTRQALGAQGFGVLTEIDVAATFKKKLDVAFRPYIILGACNPPLAHQALSNELDIGLLLPCNIIVYAGEEPDTSVVAALDPEAALALAGNDQIAPLARQVRTRLEAVLRALAE
jgi:uncharacterized protein (DUF302 family)